MIEVVNSWPWLDRAIIYGLLFGFFYTPWAISRQLRHMCGQNERIINLLAQIRDQRGH